MNIHSTLVTRTSQIEKDALYLIRGHGTFGIPIPPQLFRVDSDVIRDKELGLPYVWGTEWINLSRANGVSKIKRIPRQVLNLDQVYVWETGYADIGHFYDMVGQPDHDRHLERFHGTLKQGLRLLHHDTSWAETIEETIK